MSRVLATRAEILKLARTLGVDPGELEMLAGADAAEVRALRERVSDELFASDRVLFERAAALGSKVPVALAATLAQHALGAQLAARTAGLLDARQAGDFARRLPPEFLADVAQSLDLRQVGDIVPDIRPGQIATVARVLVEREDWVTMGAFVHLLDDRSLDAALEELGPDALLRTGFVMEDKDGIDRVLSRIGDGELRTIIAAATEHGLWAEALDLAVHAEGEQRARLAAAAEDLDDDALDGLAAALAADPELTAIADVAFADAPGRVRARVDPAAVSRPRRAAARGRARP
jgi:hypothetical protein